ncbi:hypothetical protein ACSBR2_030346 [Camellia fascicularis]
MMNMDVFDVEIVSSETIKPSSPTPSHLKTFNLSLLDQINLPFYIPTTIFYSPTINAKQTLQNLKDSLAKALSIFYPLAGRIKDHLSIDSSLFPPQSDSQSSPPEKLASFIFNEKWFHKKESGVSRRFVVDGAAISVLKSKAASKAVPNPTRFQVVASFIWNCAVSTSTSLLGSQKPNAMLFVVNVRPKMVPPMSQNSIGNILWDAVVHRREEEATELCSMVELLRGAVQKINGDLILSVQGDQRFAVVSGVIDELRNMYSDETPDLYTCNSWCGLGFYDVDFG